VNPEHDLVIEWLLRRVAEMLGADGDSIDCAAPFVDLGLSSVQAIEVAGDLERWTELTLPPTVAFDYPTIEAVAEYVADCARRAGRTLVAHGPAEGVAG
jgi:acyl carrier protein